MDKKILYAKPSQEKKSGVAIPCAENVNLKPRLIKRDREGHYMLVKGRLQEEVTTTNIYNQIPMHLTTENTW